jgi:hypothetical protein
MERTPLDDLEIIFCLACTDDGMTGASLAAVSHSVRTMAAPARYQAVALHGPRQITAFLTLLERIEDQREAERQVRVKRNDEWSAALRLGTPIVQARYLFMADHNWKETKPNAQDIWKDWVPKFKGISGALSKLKIALVGDSALSDWQYHFTAESTTHRLLSRLAPTLVHLSYHQALLYDPTTFLVPLRMPALIELTCCFGQRPEGDNSPIFLDDLNITENTPALRRLNLVNGHWWQGQLPQRLFAFKQLPPLLSHLRISNAYDIANNLRVLSHMVADTVLWPTTMQLITVALPVTFSSDMHDEQVKSHCAAWYTAATHEADISALVRTARYTYHDACATHQMYADWLDRMRGGDGCWGKGLLHFLSLETSDYVLRP